MPVLEFHTTVGTGDSKFAGNEMVMKDHFAHICLCITHLTPQCKIVIIVQSPTDGDHYVTPDSLSHLFTPPYSKCPSHKDLQRLLKNLPHSSAHYAFALTQGQLH